MVLFLCFPTFCFTFQCCTASVLLQFPIKNAMFQMDLLGCIPPICLLGCLRKPAEAFALKNDLLVFLLVKIEGNAGDLAMKMYVSRLATTMASSHELCKVAVQLVRRDVNTCQSVKPSLWNIESTSCAPTCLSISIKSKSCSGTSTRLRISAWPSQDMVAEHCYSPHSCAPLAPYSLQWHDIALPLQKNAATQWSLCPSNSHTSLRLDIWLLID